jgi:hypothetical protein
MAEPRPKKPQVAPEVLEARKMAREQGRNKISDVHDRLTLGIAKRNKQGPRRKS